MKKMHLVRDEGGRISWIATAISNGFTSTTEMHKHWIRNRATPQGLNEAFGLNPDSFILKNYVYRMGLSSLIKAPRNRKSKYDWDKLAKKQGYPTIYDFLKSHYRTNHYNPRRCGAPTLAKKLKATPQAVYAKLREMGIPIPDPGAIIGNTNSTAYKLYPERYGYSSEKDMIMDMVEKYGLKPGLIAKTLNAKRTPGESSLSHNNIRWRFVKYGLKPMPKRRSRTFHHIKKAS